MATPGHDQTLEITAKTHCYGQHFAAQSVKTLEIPAETCRDETRGEGFEMGLPKVA
jgi:hypothetical protein